MTATEIDAYVREYANFYGVNERLVDVSRNCRDGETIGIRLSLDVNGVSKGWDETFGEWRAES